MFQTRIFMPHCVIECPSLLSELIDLNALAKAVHDAAESTGLFATGDVKSRVVVSEHHVVGGKSDNYVHVITHILSGRTDDQQKLLANRIAECLCELLPSVEMLSVEVRDIRKETYSNRHSVERS
jgi:5-carboxymethyl-2-hydroxymuconate isomerase